jgi:hypothetical protein
MIILHFSQVLDLLLSQESSVSTMTRLLAGCFGNQVWFLVGSDICSLCHGVQDSPGACPASCLVGTRDCFPGG